MSIAVETGKSGPERQIPEDAEGSEVGEKFLIKEPVKQTSSATRTRIPVAILQAFSGVSVSHFGANHGATSCRWDRWRGTLIFLARSRMSI